MPSLNAVIISLFLGLTIPLMSSILPIKEALRRTLSVALDQNRSKSEAIKISINIEGKGFPWAIVSFALITSMFGISMYYLLPLALISFNFELLIWIFFIILVGLLVGFVILALNI